MAPKWNYHDCKIWKFPKKCLKWILSEEELSYGLEGVYVKKCRQANLLPLSLRFNFNDLILFHKATYNHIPLDIPDYLSRFDGHSRLRSSHLDNLSYVTGLIPRSSSTQTLEKSFFYRTHTSWNNLPLNIREIESVSEFRSKVETHLWSTLLSKGDNCEMERGLTWLAVCSQ